MAWPAPHAIAIAKTKHIRIRCSEHDDFIEIGGVICKTGSAWIEWRVTVPEQRHAAQEKLLTALPSPESNRICTVLQVQLDRHADYDATSS